MSARPEALYDIAATDAWRALVNKLTERQHALAQDVLRIAGKQTINIEEIARASGRLEAITSFIKELEQVGKDAVS